jgi:hypothetical protein
MSGLGRPDALPTWEQLLNGPRVGTGVGVRVRLPLGRWPGPRHVRSWPDAGAEEWARLARELGLEPAMTWREAWGWTVLATAGAVVAVRAGGLLG